MKYPNTRLALVTPIEDAGDSGSQNSEKFSDLSARWKDTEKQLEALSALEAELLSEPRSTSLTADDVFAQLDAMERIQLNLLEKLSGQRAETAQDVITKLEVWKSIVIPEGCDPQSAQPTDLLIWSAMTDILNGAMDR